MWQEKVTSTKITHKNPQIHSKCVGLLFPVLPPPISFYTVLPIHLPDAKRSFLGLWVVCLKFKNKTNKKTTTTKKNPTKKPNKNHSGYEIEKAALSIPSHIPVYTHLSISQGILWSAQALAGFIQRALGHHQHREGGRQATEPAAAAPRLRAAKAFASLNSQQSATDRLELSFRGLHKIVTRYLKEGRHANMSEIRWGGFCNIQGPHPLTPFAACRNTHSFHITASFHRVKTASGHM